MATRLELPNGQWIDVKDKLNMQDVEDKNLYSSDGVSADGQTMRFSVIRHSVATAAIYIKNWSDGLTDENGKPVRWPLEKPSFQERTKTIKKLDQDVFEALFTVLRKHAKDGEEEDAAEKKDAPGGETASGQTSPSAS